MAILDLSHLICEVKKKKSNDFFQSSFNVFFSSFYRKKKRKNLYWKCIFLNYSMALLEAFLYVSSCRLMLLLLNVLNVSER